MSTKRTALARHARLPASITTRLVCACAVGPQPCRTNDLDTQCDTVNHDIGKGVAVFVIVMAVLGIPALFWRILHKNAHKLREEVIFARCVAAARVCLVPLCNVAASM